MSSKKLIRFGKVIGEPKVISLKVEKEISEPKVISLRIGKVISKPKVVSIRIVNGKELRLEPREFLIERCHPLVSPSIPPAL